MNQKEPLMIDAANATDSLRLWVDTVVPIAKKHFLSGKNMSEALRLAAEEYTKKIGTVPKTAKS